MKTLCVVVLAVMIVAVTSRYPYRREWKKPVDPFELRQDGREARMFFRRKNDPQPCDETCYTNCMREVRAGDARTCDHCGVCD